MVQIVLALGLAVPRAQRAAGLAILAGAVLLENVALVATCWRRHHISRTWVGIDVAFTAIALVACAWLTTPFDYGTWAYFMYPFSLLQVLIIGVGLVRLGSVMAFTLAVATAYMTSAVAIHGDPIWNVLPNAVTYCCNAGVAWLVARELRRTGRLLDEQRRRAVGQAKELARVTEQARGARMLHDRVLQTLEMLSRPPWIGDRQLRGHVAAEASWLRRFVEGGEEDGSAGLLDALYEVCDRHLRAGLGVEVNREQLSLAEPAMTQLSSRALVALVGAVDEALVNVGKHSGASCAMVRVAAVDHGITVSVLDQGRGFDPTGDPAGFGLRSSIVGRVREAGGRATVHSSPGHGTHVELWVPGEHPAGCSGAE